MQYTDINLLDLRILFIIETRQKNQIQLINNNITETNNNKKCILYKY